MQTYRAPRWAALLVLVVLSSGSGVVTAIESTPTLTDVPEYRADAARVGRFPGPGPVAEPVIVWNRLAAGPIDANIVVADDLLVAGDVTGLVYALDARTGEERWRFDVGAPVSAISAADDAVVVLDRAEMVRVLDLASGTERWSAPAAEGASTIIEDGVVYVAGSEVQGLDLDDGSTVWSWFSPAPSTLLSLSDTTAYVGARDGRLYAVDRATGEERWHMQTISREGAFAVPTQSTVYVSAISNDAEYPAGELYALDPEDGSVRWRYRGDSGHQVAVGAVGDGIVYAGTVADGLVALREEAAPDGSPQIEWRTPVEGAIFTNAALVGDIVYFPQVDPGAVLAVDAGTGEMLWEAPLFSARRLAVTGGMLFTIDDVGGNVYALAEPELSASIGSVTTGALTASAADVPDPFVVTRMLEPETTGITRITDLAIGPDGNYYVLDHPGRVLVVDPVSGAVLREWGRQGSGEGEFDTTRREDSYWPIGAIAVGADGRVYVGDGANHRYQVFEPDGTFVRQVGSYGTEEGQFSRIFHIDVDAAGNVYAVDHDLGMLSKFDDEGRFLWRVGGAGSESPLNGILQSVVVREDDRLVQLVENGPIVELDPENGAVLDIWDVDGPGWVSFDSGGTAYSTAYEPPAVEAFGPDRELIGGSYGEEGWMYLTVGPDDQLVGWQEGGNVIMEVDADLARA